MTHAAIENFLSLSIHIIITRINGQCVESLRLIRKGKKKETLREKKKKPKTIYGFRNMGLRLFDTIYA